MGFVFILFAICHLIMTLITFIFGSKTERISSIYNFVLVALLVYAAMGCELHSLQNYNQNNDKAFLQCPYHQSEF